MHVPIYIHTYLCTHTHTHAYLWPCFYIAFSQKVPPHVLVCELLSSLHRVKMNCCGRERATTRRRPPGLSPARPPRQSGTRAARPQQDPPLPQQQGARPRLVRAPDVTHRPMSFREVLLRAKPGRGRGGRAGKRRPGGLWVSPRVSPRFEGANPAARWGRSWSCSSNFLLNQPLSNPRFLTGNRPVSCLWPNAVGGPGSRSSISGVLPRLFIFLLFSPVYSLPFYSIPCSPAGQSGQLMK